MAQYVYKCDRCEKETIVERPMAEDSSPIVLCACGGTTKRIFLAPGVSFKGKGFYSTGG